MVCSGASELAMAQWASTYAEAALGLSKAVGDLTGPCLFAVMMGISRIIFGKYGEKLDLMKFMTASGLLCVICYLLTSLSANPLIGLSGCILCGFSVGIMWPGTISLSSKKFPAGGTAMFALLAMAGDLAEVSAPVLLAASHKMQEATSALVCVQDLSFPLCFCSCYFCCESKKIRRRIDSSPGLNLIFTS